MISPANIGYGVKRAASRLRGIGPGWWSAVAAGAGVGAVISPADGRVVGGLLGGGVILAIALFQDGASDCGCADAGDSAEMPEGSATPKLADDEINGPAGFAWEGHATCG